MSGIDKVLAVLRDKPLLAWPIEVLQQSPLIRDIILVVSDRNLEAIRRLKAERQWSKVTAICLGGKRRQDSVAAGLAHVEECDYVLIHDGARPFLTENLVRRGLDSARVTGAAIAAVPVTDTIKRASEDGIVVETPPRQSLWSVQTPQVFQFRLIREAYARVAGDVTDDAAIVEHIGAYEKIKITTPHDLELADCLALRMGHRE
jgi:2-C-methyl-D-erythritol 4-phosphate cytidylyltransferase